MSRIAEVMESKLISPKLSRRAALGAMAAGAAAISSARPARARQPDAPAIARKARNLIFMVSDGMSAGTLTLADLYARRVHQRVSHWLQAMSRKGWRRALQSTYAADGPVTDSAAASSAWATGSPHSNGAISITPEGRQQVPIFVHAAQAARKTGLVTTTRITHATPAGFSANVPSRELEDDIAKQQIERGIDVLLGGGTRHFPDVLLARAEGASIVRTAAQLDRVDEVATRRLIGLFAKYHLPFVTDRSPDVPSLPAMTRKALSILSRGNDGFVLQVEGGRVDHAAHSSDAYALVREQYEFDEAIGVVMDFVDGRDDTLLILTTDHGNANPGITLYGKRGEEAFNRLIRPTTSPRSFEWIYDRLAALKSPDEKLNALPDLVEQAVGVHLGESEQRILKACLKGERVTPFAAANVWTFALGSMLADHFGVAFLSPNHTSDHVELLATGPGSEVIPPLVANADLHAIMVAALGLPPAKPLPGFDQLVPLIKPKSDD